MLAESLRVFESVEVDGFDVSTAVEGHSERFVKRLIASMFCVNFSSTFLDSRMSLTSASACFKFCWSSCSKITTKLLSGAKCCYLIPIFFWNDVLMFWHDVFSLIVKPCSNAAVWSLRLFLDLKIGHFDLLLTSMASFSCLYCWPLIASFSVIFLWNLKRNSKECTKSNALKECKRLEIGFHLIPLQTMRPIFACEFSVLTSGEGA